MSPPLLSPLLLMSPLLQKNTAASRVDKLSELEGLTDHFLEHVVGMKKAHVLKFRRALKVCRVE